MTPITDEDVRIVPANEAPWADLEDVFGTADAGRCRCQRFKVVGWIWRDSTQEERVAMLREQTACGDPGAATTSGLVAYVEDEPAGWVAVEEAYPMITQPDKHITWGELHVGAHRAFQEAGFVEIGRPTLRRVVMRIDF